MNVDEAMEEARQFGEQESKDMLFAEHIAILLATEVERLRAELATARNQSRNDADAITEQALRVLDSAEVDGDSDSVPPTVPELVELMADTAVMAREERNLWHSAAQRLKAELAAAKAASVCLVEVESVYVNPYREVVVSFEESGTAQRFADWVRKMKERGEG